MSAWQVSTNHLRALISGAMRWDHHNQIPMPPRAMMERHPAAFADLLRANDPRNWVKAYPTEFGRALLLANLDSLNTRYPRDADPQADAIMVATFIHRDREDSALTVIKAAACYSYQACEVTDWESCWANIAATALRECAINAATENEPWGIK